MKKLFIPLLLSSMMLNIVFGQTKLDSLLPVRGICLPAPNEETLDPFLEFIKMEMVPMHINTLVLRIGYNYEFKSHPELRSEHPLSKSQVRKIVKTCRENGIRLIPQINMFGHQSGGSHAGPLLKAYPQFNETPWVDLSDTANLKWPNKYGYYCLSYCPLHPDLHKVTFDVIDEIVDVFEADAFHAGMDEIFYMGDEKCPRCSGKDNAELFAGEVTAIRNHLALSGKELWIWGDRLIDGKTTGIGIWEASYNNTYRAIDLIPKDVVINDWHYERPDPTAAMFALKGFRVITCPWNKAEPARIQIHDMVSFRKNATPQTRDNYDGVMETIWTNMQNFLDGYYGRKDLTDRRGNQIECFKAMFEEINNLKE